MIHSEGMVSVDAEDQKPSEASIEFVKRTDLFQELVSVLGKEHAIETVKNGLAVLPTESPVLTGPLSITSK